MDEHIKQARQRSVDWNDVRRRRVWSGIVEQVDSAQSRRRPVFVWAKAGLAGLAGLAVLALGAFLLLRHQRPTQPTAPGPQGTLTLADGSRIELGRNGRVAILDQEPHQIRVRQSAGTVTYRVRHDEQRRFSVTAGQVTVTVKGTVFTVALHRSGKVTVSVSRGLVEVRAPGVRTDVPAGSQFDVPRPRSHPTAPQSPRAAPRVVEGPATRQRGPGESGSPGPAASNRDAGKTRPRQNKARNRPAESVSDLLAAADRARRQALYDEAISLLQRITRQHPSDPRVPSVFFTLGRLLRARGRAAAAARAFRACRRKAPHGPLAEDALAAEALAWMAAKRRSKAQALAMQYLSAYPHGPHAARLKRVLEH